MQKERFIGIAPWGAPVSPLHQSPRLGAGLLWRSLGRSLLANAMRVRLVLRLAAGWRQPPATRVLASSSVDYSKHILFLIRASPLSLTQKYFGKKTLIFLCQGCRASHGLRRSRQTLQKLRGENKKFFVRFCIVLRLLILKILKN